MPAFSAAAQIVMQSDQPASNYAGTLNSFAANDEIASPTSFTRGRCRGLAIATIESIDAARRVNQLLLAGEKRMASRTNFHVQIALFGRTRLKIFAASTSYCDLVIFRMNSRFHFRDYLLLTFSLLSQQAIIRADNAAGQAAF
jgi:hypothetical protein